MSDLAAKTCVPCREGVPPLKGEELAALEKQVDSWNVVEEHHITKTFQFPNFREALSFVNSVGELAEVQGDPRVGRIIFYVEDVDWFWAHINEKDFGPARPRDAAWGEWYFHLHDPDGHELSFAQPIH